MPNQGHISHRENQPVQAAANNGMLEGAIEEEKKEQPVLRNARARDIETEAHDEGDEGEDSDNDNGSCYSSDSYDEADLQELNANEVNWSVIEEATSP